MQQIPIESLNLPKNISFPVALTENGKEVGYLVSMNPDQYRKQAMARFAETARLCREEAIENGMTEEIHDDIMKDLS